MREETNWTEPSQMKPSLRKMPPSTVTHVRRLISRNFRLGLMWPNWGRREQHAVRKTASRKGERETHRSICEVKSVSNRSGVSRRVISPMLSPSTVYIS
jgi:hypothetical protein